MSECEKRQGYHLLTDAAQGLVTGADKVKLFERLCQRSAIRAELGIRPLNIPKTYWRRISMMNESRYDALMQPYVDAAFSQIDGPDSVTRRLLTAIKAYQRCVTQV